MTDASAYRTMATAQAPHTGRTSIKHKHTAICHLNHTRSVKNAACSERPAVCMEIRFLATREAAARSGMPPSHQHRYTSTQVHR